MYFKIPEEGYHLTKEGIAVTEAKYNAKFMGSWAIRNKGGWSEMPVDVFYVEHPDRSKGHSNYFGIYLQDQNMFITDAQSAFVAADITGVMTPAGEVLISGWRHDCKTVDGCMVDGGRDYLRCSGGAPLVWAEVQAGQFIFTPARLSALAGAPEQSTWDTHTNVDRQGGSFTMQEILDIGVWK